jgi:hypothetical protein
MEAAWKDEVFVPVFLLIIWTVLTRKAIEA